MQAVFTIPRPGQTWAEHLLTNDENKAYLLLIPTSAVGLGIDIVLFVMPIRAVLGLQLPTKQKIGVISIFMFGLLYEFMRRQILL